MLGLPNDVLSVSTCGSDDAVSCLGAHEGLNRRRMASLQDYFPLVRKEEALAAVEKNLSGSKPKELFEDALEVADAQFDKDRAVLKEAVKQLEVTVSVETTFDEFNGKLEAEEKAKDIIRPNRCACVVVHAFNIG